jgi:FkbM family methyltransferase
MKAIRIIIVKLLGIKGYVSLVSRIYLLLVRNGFLKNKYPELFFLKKIVKPGFVCIDIGANVGYYSIFMSKFAGREGKVYSVEPIPWFAEIWKKNVRKSGIDNVELINCALGGEEKTVQMGIPEKDGVIHHGMTKITDVANDKFVKFFDVEMRVPDEIFAALDRLDFVKCDVEGYESEVFRHMQQIIEKFKPIVQSELSGQENRKNVVELFRSHGYSVNLLNENNELVQVSEQQIIASERDFYFLPENK